MKRFLDRIDEKSRDPSAAPVLIVALGDSVTQGCMELDRIDPEAVYHRRLLRLLEQEYPQSTFSVINAGCGGESAPGGLARLDRDVLRHGPDLLIVGYGLNDAASREIPGLAAFTEALATIVRRARAATGSDIVLLTPNMMLTRDNAAIPDRYRTIAPTLLRVQTAGILAAYAQAIRRVGTECGVPVADVYAAWNELAARGSDTTALLSNGLNHPTRDMHALTARLALDVITSPVHPNR